MGELNNLDSPNNDQNTAEVITLGNLPTIRNNVQLLEKKTEKQAMIVTNCSI